MPHTLQLLLLTAVVSVLSPNAPAQQRADADTTYSAGFRATHDVIKMLLSVKRLDLNDSESLDFLDEDALHDAVRTVTVFDGTSKGASFDADALPDTVSLTPPYLSIRSLALAHALAAFRPHYIGRVFSPPFDTLVVNKRGQQRKRKDFSISYSVGFRNAADRDAFVTAVEGIEGVIWVYENRRLDAYSDDL